MFRIPLEFLLAVIPLIAFLPNTNGAVQCYKCTTTKPPMYSNETVRLCSDFDYSERYIVDCPYSTFCMKRYFTAKIPYPINATERDCANQKFVTQNLKNGRWQPEIVIEEPYQEGCTVVDDKGFRTSTTEDCYCKGRLCNTGNSLHIINLNAFIAVTITVIVMRM